MHVGSVLACSTGENSAREQAPAMPSNVVALTATDYAFRAPDTIAGGWTTFRFHNNVCLVLPDEY